MNRLTDALAAKFASPVRSTRLSVVLGRWLAFTFMVCFATGLFSHGLQNPPGWMFFLTRPIWIYQLTQGVHITSGIASIPLLFAKLWSVYPELLSWPPVRSVVHALERGSIGLFVSASLLQVLTGLINTYKWYPWPFPFRQTHYWLAWVIMGSLLLHIAVKLPLIAANWRRARGPADTELTTPEPADAELATAASGPADAELATAVPEAGRQHRVRSGSAARGAASRGWSRRGFLAAVGVTTGAVVLGTAGQSFAWLSPVNFFAPRKMGTGPQSVPVNRTAADAKVGPLAQHPGWALKVSYRGKSRNLTLSELAALPQTEHELPIACVEGWSQTARWRGVQIRDLVQAMGAEPESDLLVTSLEPEGAYRLMTMPAVYTADQKTLVALALNGEVLDLDHGYPARIIAPGRPGVLQTKWLQSLEIL
ncbi:molybdopterin-dependent oxidoreductase [Paeniglutamicibacter antarcticus]|uniref:Molybdopterin-dependent oxidoreductase n=1 Tax=Arthrobacter terrae TaxID=2935737 RepID=A0A931G5K7_9MICC|nr:molybdopterin-dependent oxidoreductase [Arthrobacter terrae]MBG0740053.1 molybdopterin-dependent oxidoreductase [Arthrobacter terrae]